MSVWYVYPFVAVPEPVQRRVAALAHKSLLIWASFECICYLDLLRWCITCQSQRLEVPFIQSLTGGMRLCLNADYIKPLRNVKQHQFSFLCVSFIAPIVEYTRISINSFPVLPCRQELQCAILLLLLPWHAR